MGDETKGHKIKVDLDLDLDRHLMGRTTSYDEDGVPDAMGPTTLEDVVIDGVVRAVVREVVGDDWYRGLASRIKEVRDEVIREAVEPMVAEALEATLQPTNSYGEPKGEPKTLRDVVLDTAKKWLTTPTTDRYSMHAGLPPVQRLINEAVKTTLDRELREALEEGKAEVKTALRDRGAALMAEAIEKMAVSK